MYIDPADFCGVAPAVRQNFKSTPVQCGYPTEDGTPCQHREWESPCGQHRKEMEERSLRDANQFDIPFEEEG